MKGQVKVELQKNRQLKLEVWEGISEVKKGEKSILIRENNICKDFKAGNMLEDFQNWKKTMTGLVLLSASQPHQIELYAYDSLKNNNNNNKSRYVLHDYYLLDIVKSTTNGFTFLIVK